MSKRLCMLVVLAALLLTGCAPLTPAPTGTQLVGSGKMADRSYAIDGFTAIAAEDAFKVKLFPGDRYLVEVTAEDNLLDYVKVTKEGDTLHIGYDFGDITSYTAHGAEARITMPTLTSVQLAGAAHGNIGAGFIPVSSFEAKLTGASQLAGYVQATAIRLAATGASQYTLNGKAANVTLNLNGASKADLGGLTLDQGTVVLDGASSARLNPAQGLDYDLRGASHLQYGGSPALGQALAVGGSSATRQ